MVEEFDDDRPETGHVCETDERSNDYFNQVLRGTDHPDNTVANKFRRKSDEE